MKLYGGIDLHSNNSVIHIIDDQGDSQLKKKVTNDLAAIVMLLKPFIDNLVGLVVESTYNWYWLVDGLMEAGFNVHLANTAKSVTYGLGQVHGTK
jgi:transposase